MKVRRFIARINTAPLVDGVQPERQMPGEFVDTYTPRCGWRTRCGWTRRTLDECESGKCVCGTFPRARGFTLIEIVVVMAIVGILIAMAAGATKALQESAQRSATAKALARSDEALTAFVMIARRLPCPANGTLGPADAMYGAEQRDGTTGDCLSGQQYGVLPWRSLGLTPNEALDGYTSLLTYRVAPGLTRDEALNLAWCDPAGALSATPAQGCRPIPPGGSCVNAATCTPPQPVVYNRGLEVHDGVPGAVIASPALGTAAAYVVISHGPNRAHAMGPDGVVQADVGTVGAGEVQNAVEAVLAAYYVDQPVDGTTNPTHFDDAVSRPTMMIVANRANLGPRAH